MNAVLRVDDIIVHNEKPTVQDLRLAEVLGYEDLHKIRNLIQRSMGELQRYGEVSATVAETSPKGGRPGVEYCLNDGQALVIVSKSDAKNAPDAREQIIRVFLAWRRGEFGKRDDAPEPLPSLDNSAVAIWRAKIDLVREARIQFGAARARLLWEELGLPAVPQLPPDDQPQRCLGHLMDWRLDIGTVGENLLFGFQGDKDAAARLLAAGIRIEDSYFAVANSHPLILRIFRETAWRPHYRTLRRVEGAEQAEVAKYGKGIVSRGVRIPAFHIDAETVH